MKELPTSSREMKERLIESDFSVIIIGDAHSGKSTLINFLEDKGFSVRHEPENPKLPLFVQEPSQYAYFNQLYKTMQLMGEEQRAHEVILGSDLRFNESGVLATDVYNRYLRDQNLITADQFEQINNVYTEYLDTMPKPKMVVYLYANDAVIKDRAIKRDGRVVYDPTLLQPYWDRLLGDLERRSIPVYRVNTGDHPVEDTAEMILRQTERLRQKELMQAAIGLKPRIAVGTVR